jgi:ribosome-associated protein
MIAPDDPKSGEIEEGDEGDEVRPSRTELTRAAGLVNRLGQHLTTLSPGDLDRLELPERVREAIDHCQTLKPRSRGRQNRLIGQLLRAEDHEAIRARVDSLRSGKREDTLQEKRNERWVERLVLEGDTALNTLVAEYPDADRQRLRVLARSARQGPEASSGKRARRELLRAIRTLRA